MRHEVARRRAVLIAVSVYAGWAVLHLGLCIRLGGEACVASSWWLLFTGFPTSLPFALAFGRCRPFDLTVLGLAGAAQWGALAWLISGLVGRLRRPRS